MNLQKYIMKAVGAGSIMALGLGLSASFYAGPSPDYWQTMEKMRTENKAKAVNTVDTSKAADPAPMSCEACKTVTLRDSKWVGPPSKSHPEWFTVGVKHTCAHCGGEIKVVRGTTTNSMQHNCTMCGIDAIECSVAVQASAAKT